jgi:hypothetical protein
VNLISSSFADELIGKLVAEYGFHFFISTIKITNVSSVNIPIVNRSIEQRMAQQYYGHEIKDSDQ